MTQIMSRITTKTDPTGRHFISYRRSRLAEVARLIPVLHEHGIPTWQDKKDLQSEPTVEAIVQALDSPQTAGGILWLSRDVEQSPIILQEEAPRIFKRARAQDGFAAKLCLADGIAFGEAHQVLAMPGSFENPSAAWNLRPVEGNPATAASILAVSHAALDRRVATNHARLDAGLPIRLSLAAHAKAAPAFQPGVTLQMDWTSHFSVRHTTAESWQQLLPSLSRVTQAVRTKAPGRRIEAEGFLSLASAFALGHAFMEPSGLHLSWKQQLPGGAVDLWSLAQTPEDSGLSASTVSHDAQGLDLAVFISMRGDVESAVVATPDLPKFRAVTRVQAAGSGMSKLTAAQAVHAARLAAEEIRSAKQRFSVVRKIHVFFSGPAGVAVLIGQQLNALGPVQLYELDQTPNNGVGTYLPAALLCD